MDAPLSLSDREAVAQGYRALAGPYIVSEEQAMLDNVIRDMQRGSIEYVLVKNTDNRGRSGLVEVWRRGLVRS
jgi:hypothetical protein